MANAKDAQNLDKIEKGIEDLIAQSKSKISEDLEKEAAVLLQRQMQSTKRDMLKDIELTDIDMDNAENTNKIYQNAPEPPPSPSAGKRGGRDQRKMILETNPDYMAEAHEAPDNIYRPEEKSKQQTPQDMFDDLEDKEATENEEAKRNLAQNKEQEGNDKKEEKGKGEDKKGGKEKTGKDKKEEKGKGEKKGEQKKEETPKTNEEVAARDKTPEWQNQPTTAEGGIARADTGDISPQKKKEEKSKEAPSGPKAEQQKAAEMDRQKRRERRAQKKQEDKKKKEEERKKTEKSTSGEIEGLSNYLIVFALRDLFAVISLIFFIIPLIGLLPFTLITLIFLPFVAGFLMKQKKNLSFWIFFTQFIGTGNIWYLIFFLISHSIFLLYLSGAYKVYSLKNKFKPAAKK